MQASFEKNTLRQTPNIDYNFNHHENNPEISAMLYYHNSGIFWYGPTIDKMHSNNPDDREQGIDKMKSLIQFQYVDKEKEHDACIKFLSSQVCGYKWREEACVYAKGKSVDAELVACVCC